MRRSSAMMMAVAMMAASIGPGVSGIGGTVTVLRATVEELGLRDAHGRPGGVAECIYESRGDVLLMTDPAAAARRFRDQRGAR